MTSVTIGIKGHRLLRWFNEVHVALLEADKQEQLAFETHEKKKQLAINQAFYKRLISEIQAILNQIKNAAADDCSEQHWAEKLTGPNVKELERRGRLDAIDARMRRQGL